MTRRRFVTGAIAVAAAAGVIHRFRADDRAAWQRGTATPTRLVPTPYGDIEYVTAGTGKPLLVVHGIFGGCHAGLLSFNGLLDDRTVIAPSRFGYLGSPMPADATPARQADAFVALLDHRGVEAVDVIGYSAGSVSVLRLALDHPERVRRLVLMCADLPGPKAVAPPAVAKLVLRSDALLWMAKTFAGPFLPRFIAGVPKNFRMQADDEAMVASIVDAVFPVRAKAAGVVFDAFVSNAAVNDFDLEALTVPTLIVHSRDDTMASFAAAEEAAARIPGAKLVALSSGGHVMLGQRGTVSKALRDFLDSDVQGSEVA
jgi:pimeloyl-ACP methyl ester carboxylesterase